MSSSKISGLIITQTEINLCINDPRYLQGWLRMSEPNHRIGSHCANLLILITKRNNIGSVQDKYIESEPCNSYRAYHQGRA